MIYSHEAYELLRNASGLTDWEVSRMTGIPFETIHKWKRTRNPWISHLRAVAECLGVPVKSLMARTRREGKGE